ncbi:hypothetical protein LSCM1_05939 [Leishmania martiniquensis]|uniref:Uncharacterized protein n=1 Tax=Leishmania martiniquensis TaxID=1580590 RepID=A0A836KQS4_9TRYP|nr:hypothetical protein LSCM1_05939 [Leishmania martiniquensis]
MPVEQQQHERQLPLPHAIDMRTIHGLPEVPLADGGVGHAVSQAAKLLTWDEMIQQALQSIIKSALPSAAAEAIRGLEFDLGGRLPPTNGGWPQAYKWAVALTIVLSVVCVGLVALVVYCVILERHQKEMGRSGGSADEGNAHARRAHASRSAPLREAYAEEEGDYYYSCYSCDAEYGQDGFSNRSY